MLLSAIAFFKSPSSTPITYFTDLNTSITPPTSSTTSLLFLLLLLFPLLLPLLLLLLSVPLLLLLLLLSTYSILLLYNSCFSFFSEFLYFHFYFFSVISFLLIATSFSTFTPSNPSNPSNLPFPLLFGVLFPCLQISFFFTSLLTSFNSLLLLLFLPRLSHYCSYCFFYILFRFLAWSFFPSLLRLIL